MSTGGLGVEGATVAWINENQCIIGVAVYPFPAGGLFCIYLSSNVACELEQISCVNRIYPYVEDVSI